MIYPIDRFSFYCRIFGAYEHNIDILDCMEKKKKKKFYNVRLETYPDISFTLFSFACSAFYFDIRVSVDGYRECVIPEPEQLFNALSDFTDRGNLDSMASIPNIDFFMTGTGFDISENETCIEVSPSLDLFISRFKKAYLIFFKSFNPLNLVFIK